jgi:RNA polymerase sigma factor (sigma-70 family)
MRTQVTELEWNQWYNTVYGYVYRRVSVRTAVEEITIETLEDFILRGKDDVEEVSHYLIGIARNKLNRWLSTKYTVHKPIELVEGWDGVEETSEYKARMKQLLDCAKKHTTPEDLYIIEMAIQFDFSSPQIARELNLTHTTVRKKLSRALAKIRKHCHKAWN